MLRLLPKVSAATALVAIAPLLIVWGLGRLGVVDSPVLAAGLGAALSLAAYHLAANFWQRRPHAADVLFGDLMVWGWIRRCLQQRRIADAAALLGAGRGTIGRPTPGADGVNPSAGRDLLLLSPARRVQMLERLASDLESRDPYTLGHSRRVARYSSMMAKRMGVPKAELSRIRTAAAVHDIGKLQTPLEVLRKPGKLTGAEFDLIKRHPFDGAQLVAILEDEALTETVLRHHERIDGSGYPGGLRGDEVSVGARIIAVADTFDAITSSRSYRAARPHKQALDILRAEAGTRLDGDAVDAFLSAYLGRRPFGAWIAFTDFAERLFAWLAGDAVGTGSRLAAIAAGTVAVGGTAMVLPMPAHRLSRGAGPGLTLSRARVLPARAVPAGTYASRALGSGAAARIAGGTGAGSRPSLEATTSKGRGASKGRTVGLAPAGSRPAGTSGAGTPSGATGAASGSTGSGAYGSSDTADSSGSPSRGSTVSVGAGSKSGPSVGVGTGSGVHSVSIGASSGQGTSVGVQLNGGSAGAPGSATVSAGVTAGPISAGVTATVGSGQGPAGVGVGITLGKLPPIKIP